MYTELELVNHILEASGEDTTPTLETQHPAVVQARSRLNKADKEFQGIGWWFNRQYNLKLLPNSDGKVAVPEDTLNFKVVQCAALGRVGERFVKRGKWVYDTVEHTDKLSMAVWVDITTRWAYADLPAAGGAYLMHYAAEQAFLADDGDTNVHTRLARLTDQAWQRLQREQINAVQANALKSPAAMAMLNRPRNQAGTINPAIIGG